MPVVRTVDREGQRLRCNPWVGRPLAMAVGAAVTMAAPLARAQVPATLNGAPIQVTPYALEPGVPDITIPAGTPTTTPGDTGTGTGSGTSGTGTSSNALNTLLSQSWGAEAITEAEALGVNPSALAATCVVESGCQNVGSSSGSSATGAFQMQSAAYQEGLQTALAANPSLASQVVQGAAGMSDPATEAIAASGYLMQANTALTNGGISNPTVLDARAYYNFGPTAGVAIAAAAPSDLMSTYISSAAMAGNNISATETVGQWQASVSSKIGNSASQSVLS